MNDNELLVFDGELHHFRLNVTNKEDASVTGYVQKVSEWREDNKPYAFEYYFGFYIKWDGDVHIEFKHSGDLTLFGPLEVTYHCRLLTEIYQWAQRAIPMHPEEWMEESKL